MKSNKKIPALTLSLILITCCSELSVVALDQVQPAKLPSTLNQLAQNQPPKPKPTPQKPKKRSTWAAILNLFKERHRPLGSRGVCLVSPGRLEEKQIIWSDRPLFLWQGVGSPQEIRLYNSFNPQEDQQVIWRKENVNQLSPQITFQGVQHTGNPLEVGKKYDWEIFNQLSKLTERHSFQVMELKERDRISQDLQRLEADPRLEKATDEEIARERVDYFIQQNLWSDALQQMLTVKNPSPELIQKTQETLNYLCSTTNSGGS